MLDFLGRFNGRQVLPAEKPSGIGREGTCQVVHALGRFLRPRQNLRAPPLKFSIARCSPIDDL